MFATFNTNNYSRFFSRKEGRRIFLNYLHYNCKEDYYSLKEWTNKGAIQIIIISFIDNRSSEYLYTFPNLKSTKASGQISRKNIDET